MNLFSLCLYSKKRLLVFILFCIFLYILSAVIHKRILFMLHVCFQELDTGDNAICSNECTFLSMMFTTQKHKGNNSNLINLRFCSNN